MVYNTIKKFINDYKKFIVLSARNYIKIIKLTHEK
jgi:hypothetical protein